MARTTKNSGQNYINNDLIKPVVLSPLGEDTSATASSKGAAAGAGKGSWAAAAKFTLDEVAGAADRVMGVRASAAVPEAALGDIQIADFWDTVQDSVAPAASSLALGPAIAAASTTTPAASVAAAAGNGTGTSAGNGGTAGGNGNGAGDGSGTGAGNGGATGGGNGNGAGDGSGAGTGNGGATGGGNGNGAGDGSGAGTGNGGATGGGNGNGAGDGSGDGDGSGGATGGNGKGDGDGSGDGTGGGSVAPTPPDMLVQDYDAATYKASYAFSIDDITGGFDGETVADNSAIIDWDTTETSKSGVDMHPIDSEFGFHVTDFIGGEQKEHDYDYKEGWAGMTPDGSALVVSNANTDTLSTPARLGTWLEGIGGNTVKASTEHYSTMQSILSDQSFPGDTSGMYQLDDDLWIVDYKTFDDGMPDLDVDGHLQPGAMQGYYVKELTMALADADGRVAPITPAPIPLYKDFNRDGVKDAYNAYMADIEIDGFVRSVAAVDIGNDGTVDYFDNNLNGFETFGLADILVPNESSVIQDLAAGDDYSVTLKDDGKLLYSWGNAIKRPNDIRIDAKMELPEEWKLADDDPDGIAALYHISAAELVVNHTVTNNPNDQIRPEDFENEEAIGQLPDYVEVQDPFDDTNVLWVSPHNMYSGDGTFLPSYFQLTDTGEIDPFGTGTEVRTVGEVLIGYLNEDAFGNAVGTVYRDLSLIPLAANSELAEIGAMSEDLTEGFTKEWYTTKDREPFQAVLNEDGEYEIGPRWRLQPDKYGQDLPSVVIPQDPADTPPTQNGEEKYEVGADTTTVLNLLDWHGTSPLTLSAGWMTSAGEVSENGLNLTEDFDVAFYVKGDKKPVNLYDAELVMTYEEVEVAAAGGNVEGTDGADILVGFGSNTFYLGAGDLQTDVAVLSYGADIATAGAWDNEVRGFTVDEDSLGLIGFDLDPDNYNVHLTQEVTAAGNLLVNYDGEQVATLIGVGEHLEVDDFYFA